MNRALHGEGPCVPCARAGRGEEDHASGSGSAAWTCVRGSGWSLEPTARLPGGISPRSPRRGRGGARGTRRGHVALSLQDDISRGIRSPGIG